MNKINWKQIWQESWPHIVAIFTFFVLVMVYFAPQVFQDKQLPQGDMISARGMGHDAREYHEQTGEWSHWSNSMFGGMPYNVTSGVDSKSIFRPIAEWIKVGFQRETSAVLWLLLIGFYIFMLAVGSGPWLGIVGAIAFAFGSYNLIIIGAGHVTKGWVLATVPALIGGCLLCFKRRYIIGFIITLIATGLNVYWNHQQISYYTLLMLIPMAIAYLVYTIREKEQKSFWVASAILIIAAAMAIAPAMDKLVPTWDYAKETMRGGAVLKGTEDSKAGKSGLNREYAFQWSYGKAETMTLLIPNYYGGSSNYEMDTDCETYQKVKGYAGAAQAKQFITSLPTYWGDQPFTSGPVYAGAIICFLFVLGLFVVKGPERWWLLTAAMIGILLSWGKNLPWLNNWLFDYLPLYNKFRTPSMSLIMTTTAMAMLGMLALREILDRKVQLRDTYIAAGLTGGLCLLFALFPGIAGTFTAPVDAQMPDWLTSAIIIDRRHMLTADAWRSLGFIIAAMVLTIAYLKIEKLKSSMLIAIIGVLILTDLWAVDKRFLNDGHFVTKKRNLVTMTEADKQILADKDPNYRVLNLTTSTFNDAKTSYFHKSVGGYSPAKLRRYQDIIDYYLAGHINMNVLNMLNTRYVITQQGVQYNHSAYGNAWFVRQIDWVDTPNEEIAAIGDTNLQEIAVIDTCWRSKVSENLTMSQPASIHLTKYANPGQLFYESESSETGLAVFSEVYYKTWKAYIDGTEVPVVRANYILRAIEIPAGKHTIEFKCHDDLLSSMQIISTIASILIVLVVLMIIVYKTIVYIKENKSNALTDDK